MHFFAKKRRHKIAWILIFAFLFSFVIPNLMVSDLPFFTSTVMAQENETKALLSGVILMGLAYIFEKVFHRGSEEEIENSSSRIGDIWREERNFSKTGNTEVLGFFVNWNNPLTLSYPSLQANSNQIDMVAPFWYTLTKTGELKSKYTGQLPEVVKWAKNHGQKLLPLINNHEGNYNFLIDARARDKAIRNIVSLVKSQDYDGVNLDFEFIPSWTRESYTNFVRKLSSQLKSLGKMVTISVFPKVDVPAQFHKVYDYGALVPYVDRFVMMTYDHHWSSGPPGPIAPIDWVENNIRYALRFIPPEKLLLGIANYGYDWPAVNTVSARSISEKEALRIASQREAKLRWDNTNQSPYFYYWEGSQKRIVWFENSYSLRYKLKLVKKYDLAGIAIWRLGNASDRFWQVIREEIK